MVAPFYLLALFNATAAHWISHWERNVTVEISDISASDRHTLGTVDFFLHNVFFH
jgi:hypothetical protein